MSIFQNATRGSVLRGCGMQAVLAGASGVYLTRWGMFGFVLSGIPLWCFGVMGAAGGVMFFLGPMVYGSASVFAEARPHGVPERTLFLYLRPFELDMRNVLQLLVGASAGALVYLNLLDRGWLPVAFLPLVMNISKEQSFRHALDPLGELIAFGRPGERLQPVGASRRYLNDDWKQEITRYMARARLVIVRPGASPSIRWEVGQVLKTVPPERILFYLRFRGWGSKKERAYGVFRRSVRRYLGAELPERLGEERYLVFDTAGRPRLIREASRPSELVRQFLTRSGDVGTDRFRPVLREAGLELPVQTHGLLDSVMHGFKWLAVIFCITVVGGSLLYLLSVLILVAFTLLARLAPGA
jgi:hypothetical protein